jgi:hypothetical protein
MSVTTTHTHEPEVTSQIFGLMAEFETPEAAVAAVKKLYGEGYRAMEAYSPFPVDELSDALGFTKNRVPLLVLVGGVSGALLGFGMQTFSAVVHYPLNIGGRPYFSWPSFMPVTFELGVLLAAFSAVFGMLALNGLPRLNHPVFNVPNFAAASSDRFFVLVSSTDPLYDANRTRELLASTHPTDISEVES